LQAILGKIGKRKQKFIGGSQKLKYDKDLYQQIDNFLAGTMNSEEHYAFEQEIAANPDLSKEVDVYRMANEVVKSAITNELRREIKTGIETFDRKEKIKKWTIAGIMAVLIIGIILFYFTSKKDKSELSKEITTETLKAEVPQQATILIPDSILKKKEIIVPTPVKPAKIQEKESITENKKIINKVEQDSIILPIAIAPPLENPESTIANNNPKTTKQASTTQTTDCSNFKLKTKPEVLATCPDKYEGSIDFTHVEINHGKKPYTLKSSLSSSDKLKNYSNLPAGNYQFILSDAQGCQQNIEVEIPEKICHQKDFIINTSIGESWIPPVGNSETYDLQIVDIKGKMVFSKNQVSNLTWQGTDNYGQTLPSGLYVYLIKFDDQKIHNGQITIIR
jgi:hypothetical protein